MKMKEAKTKIADSYHKLDTNTQHPTHEEKFQEILETCGSQWQ
jgi:DnaJ-class molecular chaperone